MSGRAESAKVWWAGARDLLLAIGCSASSVLAFAYVSLDFRKAVGASRQESLLNGVGLIFLCMLAVSRRRSAAGIGAIRRSPILISRWAAAVIGIPFGWAMLVPWLLSDAKRPTVPLAFAAALLGGAAGGLLGAAMGWPCFQRLSRSRGVFLALFVYSLGCALLVVGAKALGEFLVGGNPGIIFHWPALAIVMCSLLMGLHMAIVFEDAPPPADPT